VSRRSSRRFPAITSTAPCPCGLGETLGECCGPLHAGSTTAATAERLMRSRYSAFAVADEAYLLRTWHPSTRPARVELDPAVRWTRLEVVGTTGGGALHAEGTVEFRAHLTDAGHAEVLHENSRFTKVDGQWVYVAAL
jgi:SEC-C motif-containing protein